MHKTLVSTETLARHLDDPKWVVFDCRFDVTRPEAGREGYLKKHIPGAIYADLDADWSSPPGPGDGRHPLPDPDTLCERLSEWGVGADSQVVVYDDGAGSVAARIWWTLRWLGHDGVALLDGCFGKWLEEGRPVSDEIPQPSPAVFRGAANDAMWISTGEVERLLDDDASVVIDARPPERFSGERETVDAVGGHIPNSVNHPLMRNIGDDGCFLPPEQLRRQYRKMQKPVTIHSCGSGVTACHNLLAMEVAGLPGSRLYVGSWSEWIASPQRPTARGE